jgi:dTDP-glucose 4,6-dehydratase
MKKILITGASGFLGNYFVEEFIKDHEVICLLRPNTKNLIRLEPFLDKIKVIYHDILQPVNYLAEELEGTSVILHAAGNPSSENSTKNPLSSIKDNIIGTAHVLDLAKDLNLERFFFYSTAEVYGPVGPNVNSKETDPYNILTMYAGTKVAGDSLCFAYHHTYNIPMSIMYVSNTFGPKSQSNRFPVFTIKNILNKEPIKIHRGSDGSISGRRWFHAQDVANHTRLILNNQKTGCEKWNSTGLHYYSNIEFAKMIANAMGVELNYEYVENERIGNAPRFSCDPSKLVAHGWEEPLNIQTRVNDTVEWYLRNTDWLTI